jgi:pimeloyl-ACP methyl ester carboxylesterase
MKNVYFFSGLGADERVFQFLNLSFCNPVFIKWNLPLKNECIENYAAKLLVQIQEKNPVLVGVSFGGMMAIEVAKLITIEKIIIISSAKTRFEIPFYFRFLGKANAHKIIPTSFLKSFKNLNQFIFGVDSFKEQQLLNEIIQDTHPDFLKWAIDKIVHWQNKIIPSNITHIHGTNDRILPLKYISADFIIQNGGHFMIVNQSDILGNILNDLMC